jgi:hypothetical protein
MEGIIWLFLASTVAIIAVGVVRAGRRSPSGIDPSRHCLGRQTPMSLRRLPLLKSHAVLGESVCPHCGSRSRSGKAMSQPAF